MQIYTDHTLLPFLNRSKFSNQRLRWSLFLYTVLQPDHYPQQRHRQYHCRRTLLCLRGSTSSQLPTTPLFSGIIFRGKVSQASHSPHVLLSYCLLARTFPLLVTPYPFSSEKNGTYSASRRVASLSLQLMQTWTLAKWRAYLAAQPHSVVSQVAEVPLPSRETRIYSSDVHLRLYIILCDTLMTDSFMEVKLVYLFYVYSLSYCIMYFSFVLFCCFMLGLTY